MLILALLIIAFLFLSGVMAAVDAALLSITRPEVHELVLQGKRGARNLRSVREQRTRAMIVVVILTNTVNVLGPVLVSQQTVARLGVDALSVVTVVMTLGTIVASEIIPKAVGTRYATLVSRLSALPIRLLQWGLYPLVASLEWLSALFASGHRRIGTEDQIRSLTTIGREAGYIEHDEGHLIHRAFTLNDRTAEDIMTPMKNVVSVAAGSTIGQVLPVVRRAAYSRFPVVGDSPNDILGIVMMRDLLEAAIGDCGADSIRTLIRPTLTVAAGMRSDHLLLRFRDQNTHLAIVRKDGQTIGVVSLEDVLEELVGEIEDELDVRPARPNQ